MTRLKTDPHHAGTHWTGAPRPPTIGTGPAWHRRPLPFRFSDWAAI